MKLGFTGTRDGMTAAQKDSFSALLRQLPIAEFHHGDCVGSDEDSHNLVIASDHEVRIVVHPPVDPSKRAFVQGAQEYREPLPYLERNRNIVDETERLVATPLGFREEPRGGTWYTIRYAREQGHPVGVIYPDGSIAEQ